MISRLCFGRSAVSRPAQPIQVTQVSSGLDVRELDLEGKIFDDSYALACHVVEDTPVYGIHESMHQDRDLQTLQANPDKKTIKQLLANRGVSYKTSSPAHPNARVEDISEDLSSRRIDNKINIRYFSKYLVGNAGVKSASTRIFASINIIFAGLFVLFSKFRPIRFR